MQYRRLGSSGLQLSALSLGAWLTFGSQVGRSTARDLVAAAWDAGINFFDNAEGYANGAAEEVMGDVIADLRLPRDGFCVSSKVFFGSVDNPRPTQRGLSRKHVNDACHAALKRLRVDYLDLFFCHRPDAETPIAETVAAMDALVQQGKVLYWGTSEWSADQIREAHDVAHTQHMAAPTMEQPQYNLLHRQRVEVDYAALYDEFGMGTTVWSPLASGVLTGKYNGANEDAPDASPPDATGDRRNGIHWLARSIPDAPVTDSLARARRFADVAAALGVAPAPLALAWCLRNPRVSTVILGASRVEQLEQNLTALDVLARVDEAGWHQVDIATG